MSINRTKEQRQQAVSTVFAGVTPQSTDHDQWEQAVSAFKANVTDPAFAELLAANTTRLELFINTLVARKESAKSTEELSQFLCHRQLFNRLSMASKEECILPWVESLDTSEQRARVLGSNAWLRNIVRHTGKEKFIPTISSLLDSLSTDDLRTTILSESGYVRNAIDGYMPRDKAREWLDKITPKV